MFFKGHINDRFILMKRFMCGLFSEFDNSSFFKKIVQLILVFLFLFIFKGNEIAVKEWKERIKTIINHPSIPDLLDVDEIIENNLSKKITFR